MLRRKKWIVFVMTAMMGLWISPHPSGAGGPEPRFLVRSWLTYEGEQRDLTAWLEINLLYAVEVTGINVALDFDQDRFAYVQAQLNNQVLDMPVQNGNLDRNNDGIPDRVVVAGLSPMGKSISANEVWLARVRFKVIGEGTGIGAIRPKVLQFFRNGLSVPIPRVWPGLWNYYSGGAGPAKVGAVFPDSISRTSPVRLVGVGGSGSGWEINILGPGGFPGFPGPRAATTLSGEELDFSWPVAANPVLPSGGYQVNITALQDGQAEDEWQLADLPVRGVPLEVEAMKVTIPEQPAGGSGEGELTVDVQATLLNRGPERTALALLMARRPGEPPVMAGTSWITAGEFGGEEMLLKGQLPAGWAGATDVELSMMLWSNWIKDGGQPLAPQKTVPVPAM